MINFDSVDFSECRTEEVISFFWRSVYIQDRQQTSAFFKSSLQNVEQCDDQGIINQHKSTCICIA